MRTLAPLLLVLGLCACGSSTIAGGSRSTTLSASPKSGRAVFATSGPNAATCDIAFHQPNVGTHAYCVRYPRHEPRLAVSVVMRPSGSFRTCTGKKCVHKLDAAPLKVGEKVGVGPFRCSVLAGGVLCDVAETGRGFLISGAGVQQVS